MVVGPHPHDLCLRGLRPLGFACNDDLLSAPFGAYQYVVSGFSRTFLYTKSEDTDDSS
jgi:hypothetical protein